MAKRTKTIKSLANDLHDVYDAVRSGNMEHKSAKVLAGVADKIINCSKVRVRYKALIFNGSISKLDELE